MCMYVCFEGKGDRTIFHLLIFFWNFSFLLYRFIYRKSHFLDYKIDFSELYKIPIFFLCLIGLYTIDCLLVEKLHKINCSHSFATVALKLFLELRQKSDIVRPWNSFRVRQKSDIVRTCRSNHESNTSARVVGSSSRVKYP